MKVLFICCWYPTSKNRNFGVFVKEHANAIRSSENEIVVLAIVTHRDKQLFSIDISETNPPEEKAYIIEVTSCFRDLIYHFVPLQYWIVKWVFRKKIKHNFTPQLIHSNVVFPAGIIGHWLSKDLKLPHVVTEHWSRIKGLLNKPFLGKWATEAYSDAKYILPVSSFLQGNMQKNFPLLPTSKFKIVGNVIDSRNFFYKVKVDNASELHFCAIATWAHKKTPDKLPELFICALAEWQRTSNRKVKLTMIGGGDKVEDLKALCQTQRLNTEFVGYLQKTEIAVKLQQSDFFIHASTIETFGVVVAEALMCGTPVICSNVGALADLINETNGVLCDNNIENWKDAIQMATERNFNHKSIAEKIKLQYSTENIGKQLNTIYKSIR